MPYVRAFMAAAAVGVIGISGVASESAAASSQSPARPAEVRKVLEVGPNGQPSVVATFKLATTAGVRDESPEGKDDPLVSEATVNATSASGLIETTTRVYPNPAYMSEVEADFSLARSVSPVTNDFKRMMDDAAKAELKRSGSRATAPTEFRQSAAAAPRPDGVKPAWIYCSKGGGESEGRYTYIKVSIYCGRTKPRISYSMAVKPGSYSNVVSGITDSGMRWTFNGKRKPDILWQSLWSILLPFTGTLTPISVGSEVTYGDRLNWKERRGQDEVIVYQNVSGVWYPV